MFFCCWKRAVTDPPRHDKEIEIACVRKMSNHYTVQYPAHDDRKNSSIYTATHKRMKDMECFICGKSNLEHNIHVETHHFYIQKSLQNAIDWKKFGDFAATQHNVQTAVCLADGFDWNKVAANPDIFVDSPHNMIVLCKEHHTSGGKGIHHVPFPEWIAQKFVVRGYEVLL